MSTIRQRRLKAARRKGTHTKLEWEVLKRIFGDRCAKCSRQGTEKDHIVPLYQGGSDALENLQPLCPWCNTGKGAEAIDWRDESHPEWRQHFREVFDLMDRPRR